jgi:nitroreductase
MHAIDVVRSVRVVREYAPTPLTPDEMRTIVDAGRKAGSSKNTQRWEFITILDRDTLTRLVDVGYYARHIATAAGGIALIVPAPDPEHARSVLWDLGRAAQNMIVTAWAMGIGSCPITVHHFEVAARILGLPTDRECQYVIALGRPADPEVLTRPDKAGGRRTYPEVVHEERW